MNFYDIIRSAVFAPLRGLTDSDLAYTDHEGLKLEVREHSLRVTAEAFVYVPREATDEAFITYVDELADECTTKAADLANMGKDLRSHAMRLRGQQP